jgi:hypothetical protein
MSFEWLKLRIQEEKDRRQREAEILERLPRTLEELHGHVADCIQNYTLGFGAEAADSVLMPTKIVVTVRHQRDGKWQQSSKVEVSIVNAIPGYQIDHGEVSMIIEVGLLPGGKVFYRDREQDKYLTMEELTRRILDRAFFPKLQA